MQTLAELLAEHPFFRALDRPTVAMLEGCARNVHFRPGQLIFREGEPADRLFVIRRGRVALEVHVPGGGDHLIDTVDEGEVLGWSWLVPPYHWLFDARAVDEVSAIAMDALCLRTKCDEDPALGYLLMQQVSQVMYHRLQAARIRLLDVYGS